MSCNSPTTPLVGDKSTLPSNVPSSFLITHRLPSTLIGCCRRFLIRILHSNRQMHRHASKASQCSQLPPCNASAQQPSFIRATQYTASVALACGKRCSGCCVACKLGVPACAGCAYLYLKKLWGGFCCKPGWPIGMCAAGSRSLQATHRRTVANSANPP